ncbi:MAG: hypothetical protein RMA76_01650 [Deltaproteobacteria bacterium]
MRRLFPILFLLLASCGLGERDDFMIGRACVESAPDPCDEGQVCLPHSFDNNNYGDFRCRDFASFTSIAGLAEPPLAYCDGSRHVCPDGLVCRPDRIRVDGGPRPSVCKSPDDVFTPPNFDAGVSGGD